MSVLEALKGVLKLALMHDGLARGLREASKALDRRQAHVCILNESCEEGMPFYHATIKGIECLNIY